jgi:hypothetical protein
MAKNIRGKNANINGVLYEKLTSIHCIYKKISIENKCDVVKFDNSRKLFVVAHKNKFHKYMHSLINVKYERNKIAHGCKIPDEAYINENDKQIFIIEKKFQQCAGSVCEKIQTGHFKKQFYNKLYPTYNIKYIYCNCKIEIDYLEENDIIVLNGNNINYKNDLINIMISDKPNNI